MENNKCKILLAQILKTTKQTNLNFHPLSMYNTYKSIKTLKTFSFSKYPYYITYFPSYPTASLFVTIIINSTFYYLLVIIDKIKFILLLLHFKFIPSF